MNRTVTGSANGLAPDTELGEYRLLDVIGEGGFGVVYRALDLTLHREVAIKEYMPVALAGRQAGSPQIHVRAQRQGAFDAGLRGFINEARLLAKFSHRALVRVHRFFEANGTAYMVMHFYKGQTLRAYLDGHAGRMDQHQLMQVLSPILDVLEVLHANDCCHRDIAPDNIFLPNNEGPVLLDFGAARHIISGMTQALAMVLKPGFAPIEQYVDDGTMPQGAWTDVYQLGAVMYVAITGQVPTASVARMVTDPIKLLTADDYPGYSAGFLRGVHQALAVKQADRPQTITALRQLLLSSEAPPERRADEPQPTPQEITQPVEKNEGLPSPFWSPTRLRLALLAALAVAGLSAGIWAYEFFQDRQAWQEANRRQTPVAIETYLKAYPHGRYSQQALDQIVQFARDTRNWKDAQLRDSILAYQAYLRDFPQGLHINAAREKLDELTQDERDWQLAYLQNTILSFEGYLRNRTRGKFREQAQQHIEKLKEAILVPDPSVTTDTDPVTVLDEQLRVEADTKAWNAALRQRTVLGFEDYLEKHPQGNYRYAAQAQIKRLQLPRVVDAIPKEVVRTQPSPPVVAVRPDALPKPPESKPSQATGVVVPATPPVAAENVSIWEKIFGKPVGAFKKTPEKPQPEPNPKPSPSVSVQTPVRPVVAAPPINPNQQPPSRPSNDKAPDASDTLAIAGNRGRLILNITPWGRVWVNHVNKGDSPPLKELDLAAGWHHVRVANPDAPRNKNLVMRLEIKKGMPKVVEHKFE